MKLDTITCPDRPILAAIGVWDPFMQAHADLFHRLRASAEEQGLAPYALVLDPHPATFVNGRAGWPAFDDLAMRRPLIEATGVSVAVIRFEHQDLAAGVRDLLDLVAEWATLQELWVGAGQSLGSGEAGSFATTGRVTEERNIKLHRLPAPTRGELGAGARKWLSAGRVSDAAAVAGRLPVRSRAEPARVTTFWKEGVYRAMTVRGGLLDEAPVSITMEGPGDAPVAFDWPDSQVDRLIFLSGPGDESAVAGAHTGER